jgi:hypothetical protein
MGEDIILARPVARLDVLARSGLDVYHTAAVRASLLSR